MRRFIAAAILILSTGVAVAADRDALPRFTEEREAAAMFFVKKNLPELLPYLEQLKKNNSNQYQNQVREIFQVTEMLADLIDVPKRYEIELKIWQVENRANILVARLSALNVDDRDKLQEQLLGLARELVSLDVQILEVKAEQLQKELTEVNEELAKAKKNGEKLTKDRYDGFMVKTRRPRK